MSTTDDIASLEVAEGHARQLRSEVVGLLSEVLCYLEAGAAPDSRQLVVAIEELGGAARQCEEIVDELAEGIASRRKNLQEELDRIAAEVGSDTAGDARWGSPAPQASSGMGPSSEEPATSNEDGGEESESRSTRAQLLGMVEGLELSSRIGGIAGVVAAYFAKKGVSAGLMFIIGSYAGVLGAPLAVAALSALIGGFSKDLMKIIWKTGEVYRDQRRNSDPPPDAAAGGAEQEGATAPDTAAPDSPTSDDDGGQNPEPGERQEHATGVELFTQEFLEVFGGRKALDKVGSYLFSELLSEHLPGFEAEWIIDIGETTNKILGKVVEELGDQLLDALTREDRQQGDTLSGTVYEKLRDAINNTSVGERVEDFFEGLQEQRAERRKPPEPG